MRLVVDASIAMKWLVNEDGSERAREILTGDYILEAPDLIVAEVCNVAWRQERSGLLPSDQYAQIGMRIPEFFRELWSLAPLAAQATAIARALGHPVYDCFYLALAGYRRAPMVTADRRFLNVVADSPWRGLVRGLYAVGA